MLTVFLLLAPAGVGCAGDGETCGSSASSVTPFRAGKDFIYDASERVTIPRGVNVPGNYDYPFKYTSADLDLIASFGFNFIRLGISWKHMEPKEGTYDMAHVDQYRNFIREAGERGIYAMIEVHQVNWCMKGGDVPEWMCEEIPPLWDDLGTILKEADRFWKSEELRAKLIRFWIFLARNFNDLDSLFGYDILNEPTSSYGILFGEFEKCCLFPFYRNVISAIREVDSRRPIALEPNVLSTALRDYTEPFPYDNLLFSPHPYFPHTYGGQGLIILAKETPVDIREKYGRYVQEAKVMGVPVLVGEYGGPEEDKHDFVPAWLEESHRMQDQYLLGAAYWVYNPDDTMWSIVDRNRTPKPYYLERLRRPYPRFTAGIPLSLSFDRSEGHFSYSYAPSGGSCGTTEIFLPQAMMETGHLRVAGARKWSYDPSREVLAVGSARAKEVHVEIASE